MIMIILCIQTVAYVDMIYNQLVYIEYMKSVPNT